ncbi:MAG: V-type ATP synthase subunit D [Candidatus Omnitrophota bacterium]
MPKIKFTKGELKRQRDALRQYLRYLPTLQLKKQQLQLEILRQVSILEEKSFALDKKIKEAMFWIGLLSDKDTDIKPFLTPQEIKSKAINIAGIDIPVFTEVLFTPADYDLYEAPLWYDLGIESLKSIVSLRIEIEYIKKGLFILRRELDIATQRVNLFEKVKIPEAEENIRLIKIYIGDQLSNAVGRSKIAKRKIEALSLEEIVV